MKPTLTVTKTSNLKALQDRISNLAERAVYVGIPGSSAADRRAQLLAMAGNIKGRSKNAKKKRAALLTQATENISNAELLFIFSKGSPLRNQPPRPVLEPAIEEQSTKEAISAELAAASKAALDGDQGEVTRRLKRAGMAGQNAAKAYFTSGKLAPDAPSTILRKGSATPGIDTAQMRAAITYVLGGSEGPSQSSSSDATSKVLKEIQDNDLPEAGEVGLEGAEEAGAIGEELLDVAVEAAETVAEVGGEIVGGIVDI